MNIYTHTLAKLIAGLCAHGQTGARALPAAPGCPEPARGHIPGTKQGKGLFQAGAAALVGAAPAEILPFPLYLSFLHFLTPKQAEPRAPGFRAAGRCPCRAVARRRRVPSDGFCSSVTRKWLLLRPPGLWPRAGGSGPVLGAAAHWAPPEETPHPPANPGALLHLLAWWHLQDVT